MTDQTNPDLEPENYNEEGVPVKLDLHLLGSGSGEIRTVGFMPDTFRILLDFDINEADEQVVSIVASAPADTHVERLELIIEALEGAAELLRQPDVQAGLVAQDAEKAQL